MAVNSADRERIVSTRRPWDRAPKPLLRSAAGTPNLVVMALTVEEIVARCQEALTEHTPSLAVRDVLAELVAEGIELEHALGPVHRGGITTLHNAADLTVLHVAWTPGMTLYPHEHRMWAVIGMYGGQEDNAFFRRAPAGLERAGGRERATGRRARPG